MSSPNTNTRFSILLGLLVFWAVTFKPLAAGSRFTIRDSSPARLLLDFSFDVRTAGDIEPVEYLIGLPTDELPDLDVVYYDSAPLPDLGRSIPIAEIAWTGWQKTGDFFVGRLQVTPVANGTDYHRRITIEMEFPAGARQRDYQPRPSDAFLKHRLLNWEVAKHWRVTRPPVTTLRRALPAGTWFSFDVNEDGMLSLPYSSFADYSTDLSGKDPQTFRLFTGSSLGRDNSDKVQKYNIRLPANLIECAIRVDGAADGSFDPGDRMLFYGRGASGFDISGDLVTYHQSIFFSTNTYWLLIPHGSAESGRRIENQSIGQSPVLTINRGLIRHREEHDLTAPSNAGIIWVGPQIGSGAINSTPVQYDDPDLESTAEIAIRMVGNGTDSHSVDVFLNSTTSSRIENLTWSGTNTINRFFSVAAADWQSGANNLILRNVSTNSGSAPYLDHITVQLDRYLSTGNYEFFIESLGAVATAQFSGSGDYNLWDITEPAEPVNLPLTTNGNSLSAVINSAVDSTARLVMFAADQVSEVNEIIRHDETPFDQIRSISQGSEHIILAPAEYESALLPLVDHRGNSSFIPIEQVYREFAAGNRDPLAIRYFVQWALENWDTPPNCLFVVGDADHDYRNITGRSKMIIPTIILNGGFEGNYAADDQLVAINGPIPEIAIGRYPAHSRSDVENYVEKIIRYENQPVAGIWRQRLTLVADDAARPEPNHGSISVGKSHTDNSELLAPLIAPSVSVQKLYMMEYPEVSDASAYGIVKPAATDALFDLLNRGTAIISYIGHGSSQLWAQERLLDQTRGDMARISTEGQLPIWIAATCSWGHFDAINEEAFPEELIRHPDDAAIAIISTSRPIGVDPNFTYLERIFKSLFPQGLITDHPIGVVLQSVKTGSLAGQLFHLFGDPAMPLPIPVDTVSITSLNPDTLAALGEASFSGYQDIAPAGGTGYITISDADRTVTREYVIASQQESLTYTLPGATLFRGRFSVADNDFTGSIRIPKDINYSSQAGKLSIYFQSDDELPREALGYIDRVYFKGGAPVADASGPLISFETRDGRRLMSGDHLDLDEGLVLRLADPIGINVAGTVGHGIVITDLNGNASYDRTYDFIYDLNSITSGTVDISRLVTREEALNYHVKAWDNANNPAEAVIKLTVADDPGLRLYAVYNFPNPFDRATQFTFELSASAEINISIYTLDGRKIRELEPQFFSEGFHFIDWDGRDQDGGRLANGVYLYRLEARNEDQKIARIGKLAKYQ